MSADDDHHESTPPLRGLWAVMPSHAETTESEQAADEDVPSSSSDELKPRGLWSVMPSTGDALAEEATTDAISDETAGTATDAMADEPSRQPFNLRLSRDGWALVAGLAAIPASIFAYWPGIGPSLPGACLGFIAVWLAALDALSTTATPSVRRRAWIAGGLGGLALMLGPFVFTPLGNAARDRAIAEAAGSHPVGSSRLPEDHQPITSPPPTYGR